VAILSATTGIAALGCLFSSVVHLIVSGVLNGLQAGAGSTTLLFSMLLFPQGNWDNCLYREYSLNGQMLLLFFFQLALVLISCLIPVGSSGREGEGFLVCSLP